jgi:protein phosphatase
MLRAAETIQMTDTGRQRRGNEDSMYARAPVFVVADGMGGAQAGEVASRLAVEAFEQGLPDSGSPEERLSSCVEEANRRIHELSHSEQHLQGMGTTLTAAYLDDADLSIAHVGDSRAYLFRDGRLQRLTEDHSLVEELKKRGKLTEEQAEEHPQRSVITRALGPFPTVEVDTWTYPVREGDVLLLCSDGLTSMVGEERISEIMGAARTLNQAATRLIHEANEAGGRDNITVVLFRLEDVDGPAAIDDATMVGASATRAPAEEALGSGSSAVGGPAGGTATASAPASASETGVRPAPLARTQGGPVPRRPTRRSRRYSKPVAALLATLIVLFLLGAGGYLATRQLYFIGTNPQGIVTIYRGLPYDLPGGVRLYETYYVSGVPASLVPADRRSSLFNDDLRSQTSAQNLVRDLELGKVAK